MIYPGVIERMGDCMTQRIVKLDLLNHMQFSVISNLLMIPQSQRSNRFPCGTEALSQNECAQTLTLKHNTSFAALPKYKR